MIDAAGTPDLGRTIGVDEALQAAVRHLSDGERFTEAELDIVDTAYAKLGITRPGDDSKKSVASAIGLHLAKVKREASRRK